MQKINKITLIYIILTIILAFFAASCSSPDTTPQGTLQGKTGYFIDGPVKGLTYTTSSGKTGVTDENGLFIYTQGETIIFSLGSLQMGIEVNGALVITPLDVCGAGSLATSTEAVNIIRLLLALDTGENPFGITIPADIIANIPVDFDLTAAIQGDEATFLAQAEILIEAVTQTQITPADIPSTQDAQDHFDLSEELIDAIETGLPEENLFVAVKIPAGKTGEVSISYSLDVVPPGVTSYISGQTAYINDLTSSVSFSESMYNGNWTLNLFQLQDPKIVQTGDIFSFYHSDGFKSTVPTGYPLTITENQVNLQADLSVSGSIITAVNQVSGFVQVPKFLPNGIDFKLSPKPYTNLTIFYSILDPVSIDSAASFNVNPTWPASTQWIDYTDPTTNSVYYQIPYSTSLPSGFLLSGQIYLYHGDHVSAAIDNYDAVEFYSFSGPLSTDIIDSNYIALWETVERSVSETITQRGISQGKEKSSSVLYTLDQGFTPKN